MNGPRKCLHVCSVVCCMAHVLWTHRAVKHHTVALALALNVGCQIKTDSTMTDGIHRLCVKEVMWPSWNRKFGLEKRYIKDKHLKKIKSDWSTNTYAMTSCICSSSSCVC